MTTAVQGTTQPERSVAPVPIWLKSLGSGKGVATVNNNNASEEISLEDITLVGVYDLFIYPLYPFWSEIGTIVKMNEKCPLRIRLTEALETHGGFRHSVFITKQNF
jgi:hypothetical protein